MEQRWICIKIGVKEVNFLKKTKRIRVKCNSDCFNCIYDDCLRGQIIEVEIEQKPRKKFTSKAECNTVWKKRNIEKVRLYQRQYYHIHKEQRKEYFEKYKKEHPDKVKEYSRKYYQKNRKKILQKKREQYRRKTACAE